MYRYARLGQRYEAGELPGSAEEAGIFDDASSITIYDAIPADQLPPEYPRPPL